MKKEPGRSTVFNKTFKIRRPSMLKIWVLVIFFIISIFCIFIIKPENTARIKDGKLNASYIDHAFPIALNGKWEYYDRQFLFSSDFSATSSNTLIPEYRTLPGTTPSSNGYGTYRLNVSFLGTTDLYSLRLSGIQGAARIYIDGKLLSEVGFTSSLREISEESKDNQYIVFPLDTMKRSHEIIIHISNFSNDSSGITRPIYFGTQINGYRLSSQFKFAESVGLISVGILAILLIFILVFKITMKNSRFLLLFTLILTFYVIYSSNDILTQPIRAWSYPILSRLSIIAYALMGYLMVMMARPSSGNSRFLPHMLRVYRYATPLLILFVLIFPSQDLPLIKLVMGLYFCITYLHASKLLLTRICHGSNQALMLSLSLNFCCCFLILQYANSQGYVPAYAYSKSYIFFLAAYVTSQIAYVALQVSQIYTGNARLAHRMLITNQLKSEFISATSHELRTPLHGIVNIIDSASCKLEPSDPAREELTLALTLAKKMNHVIHDLYGFYASAERLSTTLYPVNLDIEVNAVFEVFHYTMDNPRLIFKNELSQDALWVNADESRLWEILSNLIGNSVKYTESGTITITSRRSGTRILISVSDTGMGIPPKESSKIFDKSVRLEEAAQRNSGFGYGLYLVRELVEQMGGNIFVEWTKPGQGTCITFCLDACDPTNEHPETSAASFHSSSDSEQNYLEDFQGNTARLLVVDDNKDNLHIIRAIFEDLNFVIDCVQSAQDALELLEKHSYDMIISDVMMPEMSGFELCQKIRERYSHFELPVLLLTACDSTEEILTGFWSGANDYVVKPADRIELRTRVFSLITLKQSVKSALDNEMLFLQAQIRPHFLYNAFNTISAIALTDGPQASELIDDLASYLRGCFGNNVNDGLITIEAELGIVTSYVHIEQARFGKRLQFVSSLDMERSFSIPPLTIQPLVENAIRHATLDHCKEILIQLEISVLHDCIQIIVQDNGEGIEPGKIANLLDEEPAGSRGGIGLHNVNRRLRLHYGIPLQIQTSPDSGTKITIRIPLNHTLQEDNKKDEPR